MTKTKIRIYPKVYRLDNDKDTWRPETEPFKTIIVQEKLDGSNVTFGIHNGRFGIFSRTEEITNDTKFAKTDLQDIRDLEYVIREEMKLLGDALNLDIKTFLISGELLGQAKLGYNAKCSGKLSDSFYAFDIQYSEVEGLATEIRKEKLMNFADFEIVKSICQEIGINVVPKLGEMNIETWKNEQEKIYEKYVQEEDKVKPSLIDDSIQREGVVLKVNGTGMRYKIVASAFKERNNKKGQDDNNKPIPNRILDIFATDGRVEKILQKLQLEEKFNGDRKDKKNWGTIFTEGSVELVRDILEEETQEILSMLEKEMRRKASGIIKKFIEADGIIKCACCEEEVEQKDLHPERRTCPKCGLYALKRKVMKWDEEKEENYLLDQVTGERFSQVKGKKHQFKKD